MTETTINKAALVEEAKSLGVKGNLVAMRIDTLQDKIAEAKAANAKKGDDGTPPEPPKTGPDGTGPSQAKPKTSQETGGYSSLRKFAKSKGVNKNG